MCFRARGLSFQTSKAGLIKDTGKAFEKEWGMRKPWLTFRKRMTSSMTSLIDVESFEHVEHVLNHMIALLF